MATGIRRFTPVAAPVLLALCAITAAGCATRPVDDIPLQVMVPLVYVTDRILDGDTRPARYYGGGRGQPQAGTASVAVSTLGSGTSAFADWRRWEPRLEGARNEDELVSIKPAGGVDLARAVARG